MRLSRVLSKTLSQKQTNRNTCGKQTMNAAEKVRTTHFTDTAQEEAFSFSPAPHFPHNEQSALLPLPALTLSLK